MSWEAAANILGYFMDYSGTKDTNQTNRDIAEQTSAFNAQEAQKNRDFQRMMSDTSYQRAAQDMRKAGLNPALAYMQGGASTPAGSSAQGVSATMQAPKIGHGLSQAVNSALEKKRLEKDIDQAKASIKQSESQEKLNYAAVKTQAATALQQANSARVADVQAAQLNAQLPAVMQKSAYEAEKAAIDRKALPIDAVLQRAQKGAETLNSAIQAFNPFKSIKINSDPIKNGRPATKKGRGREAVNPETGEYYYHY